MKIIAFTGKMASGKTTAINILNRIASDHMYDSKLIKFADPLYKIQEYVYQTCNLPQPRPKDRKLLQYLGTEWGRSKDNNLWVNLWRDDVLWSYNYDIIFNDDCRFNNEAEVIRELDGTIIAIESSNKTRASRITLEGIEHASEKGIDSKYIDVTIYNDGTLMDLENQLTNLFDKLIHE